LANKNVYDYTVRIDKTGFWTIANETGPVEKPENPMSYVLVGIVACIAVTAKPILEKMRIDFTEVVVNGKLFMVDDLVRFSDRVECTMQIEGSSTLSEETKGRIAEITKRNCSVSVTIARNPKISLNIV